MSASWRVVSRSLATVTTVALVAAGCSGGSSSGGGSESPVRGGTMVMAINVDSATMDPAACGQLDRCGPVFGTLLRYDLKSEELKGYLADSFETEDGKNWTLKLRDGVQFSDGTAFDAEAVAFNWARVKDPAVRSPSAAVAAGMTWEVVDPLTLKVTLAKPNYRFAWELASGAGLSFIGSPTAIKSMGADFGNAPIGAGPFVLKQWTRNSQADFVANKRYFEEGLPYLDGFALKVIGQDDQRLNALRSNEIDINWSLLTKDAKTMESDGFTVEKVPIIGGTGLAFNFADPVAGDPLLQQAMLHAFDSQQINDAVYPGDAAVDQYLRGNNEFRDDSLGTFPALDLGKAQELFDEYLAEAGKTSETITFNTYAGIPALEQVAQLLQSQMEKIEGLTFEINAMDAVALQTSFQSGKFQTGMHASLGFTMDSLWDAFHSTGSLNYQDYAKPEVDAALEESRASDDPEVIADAYKFIAGQVSKDGSLRTWRYQTGNIASSDKVKDLIIIPALRTGASVAIEKAWLDE